jgi:hypothetical protein
MSSAELTEAEPGKPGKAKGWGGFPASFHSPKPLGYHYHRWAGLQTGISRSAPSFASKIQIIILIFRQQHSIKDLNRRPFAWKLPYLGMVTSACGNTRRC